MKILHANPFNVSEKVKKGEPWGSALFVANRMLPGSIPTLPLKALCPYPMEQPKIKERKKENEKG